MSLLFWFFVFCAACLWAGRGNPWKAVGFAVAILAMLGITEIIGIVFDIPALTVFDWNRD